MRKALRMPLMTIAKNAGVDAAVVVSKVLDASPEIGYDALTDEYVNMIEKGIIDPTKVSHYRDRVCRSSKFENRLGWHSHNIDD